MMASVARLDSSDFEDASRVMAKLRWRLADVEPVTAMDFFLELNTILFRSGQQELAIRLFELELGLQPEDYADPNRISQILRDRLYGFTPSQVFAVGLKMVTTLGHGERPADGLAVLDSLLGLRKDDFSEMERLAKHLRYPPDGVGQEEWQGAILMLLWLLDQVGRQAEGVAIFEAIFGITEDDYSSSERLREKIAQGSELLVLVGAGTLFSFWRFSAALALLELVLEIRPEDYRDLTHLARKQIEWQKRLPLDFYDLSLLALLATLVIEDRPADATALLASDAGLLLADFADPERVVARLRARCRSMPRNAAGRYFFTASLVLNRAGFSQAAAVTLEADLESEGLDWHDLSTLSSLLDERFGVLSPTLRVAYIFQLSCSLADTGRKDHSALLVDAYVRALSPLAGREEDPYLAPMLCGVFEIWLRAWAHDDSRQPLDVCRALVPYLRDSLARHGVWLEDRERFIREAGDLRRRIVQTGLYWATRETDTVRAEELRRTVLLWDLELAQRLLVERFLLTEIRAVPAGEPPVIDTWPLPDQEQPLASGYLPETSEVLAAAGVLEARG